MSPGWTLGEGEGGQGLGGLVSGVSLHLGSGAEGPEEGKEGCRPCALFPWATVRSSLV